MARRFADAGASRRPVAGPGGQLDVAPVRVADLDLDAWTVFLQDVAVDCLLDGQVPQRAAFQAVHALHRAYAFWHWADPIRFHCQPFPATPGERQRWVALILGNGSALS